MPVSALLFRASTCSAGQKACRDENGFKCHQTSDGHLKQMRLFAENPAMVMQGYSAEFEKNFLDDDD